MEQKKVKQFELRPFCSAGKRVFTNRFWGSQLSECYRMVIWYFTFIVSVICSMLILCHHLLTHSCYGNQLFLRYDVGFAIITPLSLRFVELLVTLRKKQIAFLATSKENFVGLKSAPPTLKGLL